MTVENQSVVLPCWVDPRRPWHELPSFQCAGCEIALLRNQLRSLGWEPNGDRLTRIPERASGGLVTRLRAKDAGSTTADAELMAEAAAELERRDFIEHEFHNLDDVAEIERLRAALKHVKWIRDGGVDYRDDCGIWVNDAACERNAMYKIAADALGEKYGLQVDVTHEDGK